MAWQDSGFLIDTQVDENGNQQVDVLTKAHGRLRGVVSESGQIDVKDNSAFDFSHSGLHNSDEGEIQVSKINGAKLDTTEGSIDLDVITAVRDLGGLLIPAGEPLPDLYAQTIAVLEYLTKDDRRWSVAYAKWELCLLQALGALTGIRRYRHVIVDGETLYYSLRSGRIFTRSEAGAFLDRLLPLPAFLLGTRNTMIGEVRQALTLTGKLLESHLSKANTAAALPPTRHRVLELIDDITDLPWTPPPAKEMQDEKAVMKRLLTLKPLTVAYAGIAKG
jgi:DNA repair protein RecO (recombination protein O)